MRSAIFLLSFLIVHSAYADMIFLNLNDAGEEIKNCQDGIDAKNTAKNKARPDELQVVNGMKGEAASDGRSMTYHVLRKKILELRKKKVPIDSIVISGDDGTGHFFGSSGDFHQSELKDLIQEFPDVGKTLQSAALWGCYPTSVHGAEQFWVNRLPNMQFTMGFTLQGPDKTRPANHILLKQFCERHEDAVKATSMDQLCKFYDSLTQLTRTSVGICNRMGVATLEYGRDKEKCFTYKQLHQRCGEFTKDPKLEQTYQDYLSGKLTPEDEGPGQKVSPLRNYYNQLNLWRHCREQFKVDRGYDMPFPPEVIRLIKYNKIRENLAKLNAAELAEYDRELEKAGLGEFKLGDISNRGLSRADMNIKIERAVTALEGQAVQVPQVPTQAKAKPVKSAREADSGFLFDVDEEAAAPRVPAATTIRAAKNPALLRMAQCLRMTLVNMDYRCTQFKNVTGHMGDPSQCLMTYKRAAKKEEDDDC